MMYAKQMVMAAAVIFCVAAAADTALAADPTGTWKWSNTFNNRTIESTLKLKLEGEKLTGVLVRGEREVEIEGAMFEDNKIVFSVTRERNGQKFTLKYNGVLVDDAITGKIEFTGRDNQARSFDWEAKREKS